MRLILKRHKLPPLMRLADYQTTHSAGDSDEVLMVLALKGDSQPYLDCLDEAGFGPLKVLDVETYAIVNAFSNWINTQSPNLENETLAVFDIGGFKDPVFDYACW